MTQFLYDRYMRSRSYLYALLCLFTTLNATAGIYEWQDIEDNIIAAKPNQQLIRVKLTSSIHQFGRMCFYGTGVTIGLPDTGSKLKNCILGTLNSPSLPIEIRFNSEQENATSNTHLPCPLTNYQTTHLAQSGSRPGTKLVQVFEYREPKENENCASSNVLLSLFIQPYMTTESQSESGVTKNEEGSIETRAEPAPYVPMATWIIAVTLLAFCLLTYLRIVRSRDSSEVYRSIVLQRYNDDLVQLDDWIPKQVGQNTLSAMNNKKLSLFTPRALAALQSLDRSSILLRRMNTVLTSLKVNHEQRKRLLHVAQADFQDLAVADLTASELSVWNSLVEQWEDKISAGLSKFGASELKSTAAQLTNDLVRKKDSALAKNPQAPLNTQLEGYTITLQDLPIVLTELKEATTRSTAINGVFERMTRRNPIKLPTLKKNSVQPIQSWQRPQPVNLLDLVTKCAKAAGICLAVMVAFYLAKLHTQQAFEMLMFGILTLAVTNRFAHPIPVHPTTGSVDSE